MLAMLTAAVLSAGGAALHVEKSGDAKLPCAANAALEQAIKVRLPGVRLAKGKPAQGDLVAQIAASPGGFRFEVRRADGSVAMSRDLFSGCAQLGDTSALILERYLAQISWAGRDVGLVAPSPPPPRPLPPPPVVQVEPVDAGRAEEAPPAAPGGPEPVDAGAPESADLISRIGVAPEPSGRDVISAAPAPVAAADAGFAPQPVIKLPPEPPRDPIVSAVDVSAGAGLWYGYSAVGGFSLDLGVVLRERVRLGLLALVGTRYGRAILQDTVKRGDLDAFDFSGFATLGVCTKTAIALCGSAVGGARVTWGRALATVGGANRIYRDTTGFISVPELGLLARASYAIASRLLLALDVLFGVPLVRGAFRIEGLDPLLNPYVDLAALFRVGVRL